MKFYQKVVLLAAGSAVIGSALTAVAMRSVMSPSSPASDLVLSADSGAASGFYTVSSRLPGEGTDFTVAAENTINGVVSIKSYATPRGYSRGGNQGGFFNDPFFEYFFGQPGGDQRQAPQREENDGSSQRQTGLGSGVIISNDGYIVTNNHVIDGAERLEVTLNDNRTFNATVVGTDPSTDIALVKIDAKDLPVIPMGDSENLKVGEWVLAVGNPFGFTSTVTTGIVSAKGRSIGSATHGRTMGIESYIQTDAAVNPGNSGGALVNLAGELVGINTAIYSQTGNYAGYSFAVPTSIVKKVVSDIREYGAVQRAVLGISIRDLTPELAKKEDITAVTQGVYIGDVSERSSAFEAGLQKGDVIVKINGVNTDNTAQLQEQVAKYRPGDKISLTYVRDNKQKTVEVKLLNNQGTTKVTVAGSVTDLGCAFKKASEATLRQLGINSGVQVGDLKAGKFKDAGIRDGFIVYSVNDTRVASPDDIEKIYNAIMKSDSTDKVMFLRGVYPTGQRRYYAVDLADND